jgi:hypothetical protein
MKKTTFFLIALFVSAFGQAQSFQEGNLLVKGGIGISSPYYMRGSEGTIPPLSLIGDYALKDKIGVGAYVGYAVSRLNYLNNSNYENYITRQSYRMIGGRATYHFWSKEHFDVYLGGMISYVFPGWKVIDPSNAYANSVIDKPKFGGFKLAGFVGLNYSVNNNWGVFGEVGYSLSYVTGGAYWRIPQVK